MRKHLLMTAGFLISVSLVAPATAAADKICDFRAYDKAVKSATSMNEPAPGALAPMPLNVVRLVGKTVKKKVIPQQVFSRRTETGTVEVAVRFMNCSSKEQVVLVRTSFLDEVQMPTERTTAWREIILRPKTMETYSDMSTSIAVKSFYVEVDSKF